ncbi:hypothetical protein [Marinobacter segnicrescens]|uniref:hypothetical protein n=1 Tax=Marinobacter segnicrescens TaxID=430453 RepID=UPI003A90A983
MKNSSFKIQVYEAKVNEIEDIVERAAKKSGGVVLIGPWVVSGEREYVNQIKESINYKEIFDSSIQEANVQTPIDDWQSEFHYTHRLRGICATKSLEHILNCATGLTASRDIEVYLRSRSLISLCREHLVKSIDIEGGQKRAKFDFINNAFYHAARAIVGLWRMVFAKFRIRKDLDKKTILVGSSDIYRYSGGRYENTVTGRVRRELECLGYKVLFMSSPHDSGERRSKLKGLINDRGAITPEAIFCLYMISHPIAVLRSILSYPSRLAGESHLRYELLIESFKRFMLIYSIDAVCLSGEYSRIPRAAITAGNGLDLPTAGIQHGVITPRHPGYTLSNYSCRRTTPTALILHGHAYQKVLEKLHRRAAPLMFVSGNPATTEFDQSSSKWSERTNRPKDEIRVLFASQPHLQPMLLDAFRDLSDNVSSKRMIAIFKLHPAYEKSGATYKDHSIIRFFKKVEILPTTSGVEEALSNVDLVISRNSTLLQEAHFKGIATLELIDKNSEYSFSETFGEFSALEGLMTELPENLTGRLLEIEAQLLNGRVNAGLRQRKPDNYINCPYATVSPWLFSWHDTNS